MMRIFSLLLLISVSFDACTPYPSADERGLSIAKWYIAISETAQNVRAFPFSEGQWRTDYVKFSLPQRGMDEFLRTNCSGAPTYKGYGRQVDLNRYRGAPDWWLSPVTPLTLKGECQPSAIFGVTFANVENNVTAYLILFL
jgi:hypothetical protein